MDAASSLAGHPHVLFKMFNSLTWFYSILITDTRNGRSFHHIVIEVQLIPQDITSSELFIMTYMYIVLVQT